jgi:hypothetical protein
LGFTSDDVSRANDGLHVKIHSIGSVPAPASTLVLRDATGKELARVATPALAAPIDLQPKTADVVLKVPSGAKLDGATLVVDPENALGEITALNNTVKL